MCEQNHVVRASAPPPGTLGKADLYAISLGYVIGAGIVSLIGPAIALTGMSAWLAYLVAILFGFVANLPAIFVTSSLRMAGGPYSMLAALGGKRLAGMYSLTFLTTILNMGAFGIAIGMYAHALWPAVPAKLAGIIAITLFYVINLFGVDIMAKVQKVMPWVMLAAFGLFIILGLFKLQNPVFDVADPEFMPNGSSGFISAIFLYVVSTNGYLMSMSYGKVAKNATRDIPWAMLMCVPTFILIYCGVTIVGAGVLPIDTMKGQTLTVVAKAIFNPVMFVIFMVGGPFMALTSTMNSAYCNNCFPVAQSARDGWLPKFVAKQNKRGAYYVILTIIWAIGMVPLVTNFDISSIVRFISMFFAALSFLYAAAYVQLPKKYPDAWKRSRYHVSDGVYYAIVIISLLAWIAIFIYSFLSLPLTTAAIGITVFIALLIYGIIRSKDPKVTVEAQVWEADET